MPLPRTYGGQAYRGAGCLQEAGPGPHGLESSRPCLCGVVEARTLP